MVTLAALANAASTPASVVILTIGTTFLFAKWAFDVYQNTFVPYLLLVSTRALNILIVLTT
jgi:hypothetical protein